jgi:hypothetical protein
LIESSALSPVSCCKETEGGDSETSTTLENVPGGLRVGTVSNDPPKNSTVDDSSFHLRKIKNASEDEIIFFRSVRSFGLEIALWLAAKCGWETARPLKLLREIGEIK